METELINGDTLKTATLNPLQLKLAELGKCYKCKGELEKVPLYGHPYFSPYQCADCKTVYVLK